MNIFPALQAVLYAISTALLYPVVILLILLSIWLVIYTGGFFAEWIKRKQYRSDGLLASSLELIRKNQGLTKELKDNLPDHICRFAQEMSLLLKDNRMFQEESIEDLLQRKEALLLRELDRIRMVVRIGPSLGLMGTLIPMGTGLAGLTQGNMAQLSASLILAFTTTVVGLASGVSAHFFSVIKQRWVAQDIRHMALISEALTRR